MAKFDPLPLTTITNYDKYQKVFDIENEEEAKAYFSMCVNYTVEFFGMDRAHAETLEKGNIAFYMHYFITHGPYTEKHKDTYMTIGKWIGCESELTNLWS